jgi:ribosomal protein S27AE
MVKNRRLAQAISDVAWGRFFPMTKGKAENAGRTFERVDPRYTSQICSKCGHQQKMPLAIRVYECGKCGYVIWCDYNSAISIDRAGQARTNARGERQRSMKRERVSRTKLELRWGGNYAPFLRTRSQVLSHWGWPNRIVQPVRDRSKITRHLSFSSLSRRLAYFASQIQLPFSSVTTCGTRV